MTSDDLPFDYLSGAFKVARANLTGKEIVSLGYGAEQKATTTGDIASLCCQAGINTQTASYTLVLTDASKTIEMNVGSANTLTIPPNSSVAFPIGTFVNITQIGAGLTTVTAGAGVTIDSRLGFAMGGQYAMGTIYKRGTDEWVLGGDVA